LGLVALDVLLLELGQEPAQRCRGVARVCGVCVWRVCVCVCRVWRVCLVSNACCPARSTARTQA
jgi:hypothetical protein